MDAVTGDVALADMDAQIAALADRALEDHPALACFDRSSAATLIREDLSAILRPTAVIKQAARARLGAGLAMAFDSDEALAAVARHRAQALAGFLGDAAGALAHHRASAGAAGAVFPRVRFRALSGDSHNDGVRPLAIEENGRTVVLKFADPRPYQFLADILRELSAHIGVDLAPPPVVADRDNGWYVVDYLELPDGDAVCGDVEALMFGMGALAAVAYCAGLVDLHLENLIVDGAKPIIIDPECIFYNFDLNGTRDRLFNTGILSHNVHLSSLRGGGTSGVPLFEFKQHVAEDGVLRYDKPLGAMRNRMRMADGTMADPANHRREVLGGYQKAFGWFASHPALVAELFERWVDDDFRIRYLARKTRHYTALIEMLNIPQVEDYRAWTGNLESRFRASGHFPATISDALLAAEWADLTNRDVPYFWVCAGETVIRHRRGVVQDLEIPQTARARARDDLARLRTEDLRSHLDTIEEFLDIDLTQRQEASDA